MSTTIKAQTIMEEEVLATIAEKYAKIPKGMNKRDDIIAAGYLTADEFDNLPYVPRSAEMTSGTSWGKIGGKTFVSTAVMNEHEKQMYYAYKNGTGTGTKSSSGSGSSKNDETLKELLELRNDLIALKAPETSIAKIDKIIAAIPRKKPGIVEQLFGVAEFSMLKGKVSVLRVMYRDNNGAFFDKLEPKPGEDIGFDQMTEPVFTKTQITEMLKKLKKDKGIDLSNCFTDWQPKLD